MEVHSSRIVENLQRGDTLPTKRDPCAFVDNIDSLPDASPDVIKAKMARRDEIGEVFIAYLPIKHNKDKSNFSVDGGECPPKTKRSSSSCISYTLFQTSMLEVW